ncbi:MAG: diphosphomevalonate decarboxylase [Candidatus Anstonellaceae archaeon]
MAKSTWQTSPNIAVVKYWGKRDNALNIPMNGSVSVTMDDSLRTITTVQFDSDLAADSLTLNGKPAQEKEAARATKVLDAIRAAAKIKTKAKVASTNNFPTAAGIASSASGFAALACAGADAAGLNADAKQLSIFARLGSGSACRSVLGGFVEWKPGKKRDGGDSFAVQIAPSSHWRELRNVIAIVETGRKKVGSAEGMEITTKTSKLYPERVRTRPAMIESMRKAILARDLEKFLLLTMEESSDLHAVMLDTFPPIMYLNDISREIMYAVHELNGSHGKIVAGYTFDAGPNAHIYTDAAHAEEVERMLRGINGVQKTIVCKPGDGPRKLGEKEALF